MPSDVLNVALAGIGGYGKNYVDALFHDARASGVRVAGFVDPVRPAAETLAECAARGIPVFEQLEQLLDAARVDLMFLATPIHLHAQQTQQAIDRGAHVLCEKPLGGHLADAAAMLRAAETAQQFVAVGYQWSFSAAIQSLKADILRGRFGRPLRMRTICNFPRPHSYFARNTWAGRKIAPNGHEVFDSPVNNATSHYLHNMLFVLGDRWNSALMPRTLQAELYRANPIENFDTAALRCMSDEGVELLFLTSHAAATRNGPRFVFEFEHASVSYCHASQQNIIARTADGKTIDYGNPNDDRHGNIWQCVEAAREAIAHPQQPLPEVACHVETALPQSVVAAAVHDSCPQIVEFARTDLQATITEGETMRSVRGLDQIMQQCFDDGLLPSERNDVAWAVPGRLIQTSETLLDLRRSAAERRPVLQPAKPAVTVFTRPAALRSQPA